VDEVTELAADLTHGVARGGLTRSQGRKPLPQLPAPPKPTAEPNKPKPYAPPHYGAAFVLIGEAE